MIPFDQRGSTINDPFTWAMRQADEVRAANLREQRERFLPVESASVSESEAGEPNEKGLDDDNLGCRNRTPGR
jgi:hypothetical protein